MQTDDALDIARRWLDEGLRVALARVVGTWGSSPRRPGSVMCVNERGEFAGSVSGGCVETAVVEEALGVLQGGEPRLLDYGVTNEDAWEVGLACGGSVEVLVERLADTSLADALDAPSDRGAPRVVATDLEGGGRVVFTMGAGNIGTVTVTAENADMAHDLAESRTLLAAAGAALDSDRSHAVEVNGHRVFLHAVNPPVRVLVIGAVHIAQALVSMVRAVGFDVVVVDPRTAFATPDRFAGVELVHAWPDEAFGRLGLDRRTAVVALTHDPKLDDPALAAAVRSDAFYVGALGSSRTHARRLERLGENGVPADRLERIQAPIGLDIGARTPGEIAASVVAEIVQTLRASR
jgi:xanthine dehydrogenase accessory factor